MGVSIGLGEGLDIEYFGCEGLAFMSESHDGTGTGFHLRMSTASKEQEMLVVT